MAGLTVANFNATMYWDYTKANTGFNDSQHTGPMVVSPALTVDSSNVNLPYSVQGTLGVGATLTTNLNSLTDLLGTAQTPIRFYVGLWYFTGATWSYKPGAVSGWSGFLSGTNPVISGGDGDGFAFFGKNSITIDNGTKNIVLTNTHASNTLTYKFGLLLGT